MATKRAAPGEIIDIVTPSDDKTRALIKSDELEVMRLVVPRGKTVDTHQVPGDITVQCLAGRAALITPEGELELHAGQLVYLAGGTPHAVRGLDDAWLLVTIAFQPKGGKRPAA
jgi:quercetin dioxygenase-like cupin family protein